MQEKIKAGMVVARTIYGDKNEVLLSSGCALTDNMVRVLQGLGIQGIYIQDELSEDIVIEDVLSEDLRELSFRFLSNGDYQTCVTLAKRMVDEILRHPNPPMDLVDIKTFKNYEYKHSISVAVLSIFLGKKMDLNMEQLTNLDVAGLLHDIGKFDIKKRVLNSKHIYNDKQMDEMKKHPMYSFETLQSYSSISSVSRNSILFHHENIDGTGYYGIAGEKLGVLPRILRVVDTYDALTSTRKHRAAFSPSYAFENLAENAGKQFDTDVVRNFIYTMPMYPVGFTIKLSNNQEALVVKNGQNIERPTVRLSKGIDVDLATSLLYKNVVIEGIV